MPRNLDFFHTTGHIVDVMYWLSFVFMILSLIFSLATGYNAHNYFLKKFKAIPLKPESQDNIVLTENSLIVLVIIIIGCTLLHRKRRLYMYQDQFEMYKLQKFYNEKEKEKILRFLLNKLNKEITDEQKLNDEEFVGDDYIDKLDELISKRASSPEQISPRPSSQACLSTTTKVITTTPTTTATITQLIPTAETTQILANNDNADNIDNYSQCDSYYRSQAPKVLTKEAKRRYQNGYDCPHNSFSTHTMNCKGLGKCKDPITSTSSSSDASMSETASVCTIRTLKKKRST